MITTCPRCDSLLSVPMPGPHQCKHCGVIIKVGDPLKDEKDILLEEKNSGPAETPVSPGGLTRRWREGEGESEDERDDQEPFEEMLAPPRPLSGVAWDRMAELGFADALYQTTRDIITAPERFFTDMKEAAGPRFIPLYGILFSIGGAALNLFWVLWIIRHHRPIVETFVPAQFLDLMSGMGTADIVAQVFLSPVVNIIVAAFILFGFSILFGARAQLHHFYRLVGFTAVVDLLYGIPVIGWIVAFLWRMALLVKGVRVLTDLSPVRAALVFILYLAISFILLIPTGLGG
ncbi:MAG TPA: Yip1 family protein [bacterium]|nr:Yip1 family protein [bacterium]